MDIDRNEHRYVGIATHNVDMVLGSFGKAQMLTLPLENL
jgi:hypothetical protein